MKILIVTQKVDSQDPILGFFHRWIAEFAAVTDEVTVIALSVGRHDLPANVRVLSLGKDSDVGRIGYVNNFYAYIIRERMRYDSVFVHMNPIYVILGFPVWKAFGKRIGLWYVHKRVDLKLRVATLFVSRIYTASKESFRLKSRKVMVTGHGIDMAAFRRIARGPHVGKNAVIVGRVSKTKRIIEAVRILSVLPSEWTLSIIGTPIGKEEVAYAELVRNEAAKLGVENRIMWVGSVPNAELSSHLADSDLALNLSATGSLDKAVLEAAACSVPVVSSNEAFRGMLEPYGSFLESMSEAEILSAFEAAMKPATISALRSEVASHHSLPELIRTIVADFSMVKDQLS